MRCFLSCFGLSKTRRKHRKPPNRVPSADKLHGSYEPLDSDVKLDLTKSDLNNSNEKAISIIGAKKKVSFNLNVKSYEPLPHVEDDTIYSSDSEDSKKDNVRPNNDSVSRDLETKSLPSNYRYQNWQESDDDMALSDLDDYGSHGDDEEDTSDECLDESGEGENGNSISLEASLDQELEKDGFCFKAKRDRNKYVFSVLNPVENLTQWKAVKAKRPLLLEKQSKENMKSDFGYRTKSLTRDTAVNTSLSNWLSK